MLVPELGGDEADEREGEGGRGAEPAGRGAQVAEDDVVGVDEGEGREEMEGPLEAEGTVGRGDAVGGGGGGGRVEAGGVTAEEVFEGGGREGCARTGRPVQASRRMYLVVINICFEIMGLVCWREGGKTLRDYVGMLLPLPLELLVRNAGLEACGHGGSLPPICAWGVIAVVFPGHDNHGVLILSQWKRRNLRRDLGIQ